MTISPTRYVTTEQFDKFDEYVHDGFGKVFEQIDNLETNMLKRFDAVDRRFDVLETRFDRLDGRVDGIDARLAKVEFELKGISKQLTFLVGKAKD